ncbi:MAG: enoyl-CoA hydratase/isomerase family protein [Betaproteobacteria bacterium]|nr:MAG: enoyl-CoA hydratase/isomerase family protein [Betaproteobacteria bacterium]
MIGLEIAGAIATATLARAPVNAIDEDWIARLHEVIQQAEDAAAVAVLLVRSSERTFSAGADLALMRSRFDTAPGRGQMIAFVREMQRAYARLEKSRLVTIAEIGGAAMGGGLELALACDLRIASATAKLGLPEVRLGLLPGAGGTQRLTLLCGEPVAKRVILGAEVLDGTEAARLGVVHWAVAKDALPAKARELAERIAALPAAALAACKRCIGAAGKPDRDGYGMELAATEELLADSGTQELVRTFLAGER